jgi:hypothetical protein
MKKLFCTFLFGVNWENSWQYFAIPDKPLVLVVVSPGIDKASSIAANTIPVS